MTLIRFTTDQNGVETISHLVYLRSIADAIVRWHINALRAVAAALNERTVLAGLEIESLVKASRCHCHRGWGPPRASA